MATILIIEDNEGVARALARAVGPSHDVTVCGSLGDAERFLADGAPDLVFSDLHLGDELSLPLLERLMGTSRSPRIIVISGDEEQGVLPAGIARLVKPVTRHQIRALLDAVGDGRGDQSCSDSARATASSSSPTSAGA